MSTNYGTPRGTHEFVFGRVGKSFIYTVIINAAFPPSNHLCIQSQRLVTLMLDILLLASYKWNDTPILTWFPLLILFQHLTEKCWIELKSLS